MLIHKLYSKNYKNIKLVSLSLLIITGCNNFSEIPSVPTDGNIENPSHIPTPIPTLLPTASPTPKSRENPSYIPTPIPTLLPTASPTPKSRENLINILKPPKKGENLSNIPIIPPTADQTDRRNTKNPSYIPTPLPTPEPDNLSNSPTPKPTKTTFPTTAQ